MTRLEKEYLRGLKEAAEADIEQATTYSEEWNEKVIHEGAWKQSELYVPYTEDYVPRKSVHKNK